MSNQPTNKKGIAVVTGASSGLGMVYADRLAKRGHDLKLVARRGEKLEALAQRLRKEHGVNVECVVADLSVAADLEKVAKSIEGDTRITTLINNAGTADVAGVPMSALNQASIMSAENCVDAALSGLDQGELITLPSVENADLWNDFETARQRLFAATQTGQPASRYKLSNDSSLGTTSTNRR